MGNGIGIRRGMTATLFLKRRSEQIYANMYWNQREVLINRQGIGWGFPMGPTLLCHFDAGPNILRNCKYSDDPSIFFKARKACRVK